MCEFVFVSVGLSCVSDDGWGAWWVGGDKQHWASLIGGGRPLIN